MEDHSGLAGGSTEALIHCGTFHRVYEFCRNNPVEHMEAVVSLSRLSDVGRSRIRDFYTKGVLSPGVGVDILHILQKGTGPLQHVFIDSYTRSIPGVGHKLRPHCITAVEAGPALKKALKEYNIADQARWKIMADGRTMPTTIAEGMKERYGRANTVMLYVSGYQTKADIVKFFSPIIMQGERKTRGEELYAQFLQLKTIRLKA